MELALKSKSQCIDNFFRAIVLDLNGNSKSSRLPKFGNPTFTRVVPSARSTLIRKFARVGRWIIKTIHRRTMIQYQVLSPSSPPSSRALMEIRFCRLLEIQKRFRELYCHPNYSTIASRKKAKIFEKKKKMRRGKKQSKAKQSKAKQNKTSNTMFRHFRWTFVARYEILHYHLYWVSQCPTISTIFHRVSAYPAIWRRWTRS